MKLPKHLIEEQKPRWTLIGKLLGYPECCIESFISDFEQNLNKPREPRPFDGTGFLPCLSCVDKINEHGKAFFVKQINSRRDPRLDKFPRCAKLDEILNEE